MQFLQQINVKNVHPLYNTRIWTLDLFIVSLLSKPLDLVASSLSFVLLFSTNTKIFEKYLFGHISCVHSNPIPLFTANAISFCLQCEAPECSITWNALTKALENKWPEKKEKCIKRIKRKTSLVLSFFSLWQSPKLIMCRKAKLKQSHFVIPQLYLRRLGVN